MPETSTELAIKRVLVALDASAHSLSALDAATGLAARLHAELLGLFVEDIDLLRLAALPFAREVGFLSGAERPLASGDIERLLRTQAADIRHALALAAERLQVPWSFQVARGRFLQEVLAVAEQVDLLVFGKTDDHRHLEWTRPGAGARTAPGQPVLVLFDGSPAALRALAAATHLAQLAHGELAILIPQTAPEPPRKLREIAAAWLRQQGLAARFLSCPEITHLAQAVRAEKGSALVLPGEGLRLPPKDLHALLAALGCPVLLVR